MNSYEVGDFIIRPNDDYKIMEIISISEENLALRYICSREQVSLSKSQFYEHANRLKWFKSKNKKLLSILYNGG